MSALNRREFCAPRNGNNGCYLHTYTPEHKDMAELNRTENFYSIKNILLHLVEYNNLYLTEIRIFYWLSSPGSN